MLKSRVNSFKTELVQLAGLLHDLGKLAVPEDLIQKTGPLSELEFNIIKQTRLLHLLLA